MSVLISSAPMVKCSMVISQATYGSMRYGLYTPIKEMLAPGVSKKELPLSTKVLAGALSGGISSCICNPTDLVKVTHTTQRDTNNTEHQNQEH